MGFRHRPKRIATRWPGVFLDLTGLPPTIEEVDAFVASDDPQAYANLVDDLQERPTYGEHWARLWLDLARYADSAGYADDPPREIWVYRDWVIKAINKNMPFDQFTIEQLAGDLLPNPSEEQLVATAFHRNTMTNNEGGTQDEEFRNAAIVDRVNTTMAVWMGTTIACAQCHDHKYDPITQQEYFRFFAILNNTQDEDRRDEVPVLTFFSDEQRRQQDELKAHIARLQAVIETPTDQLAHEQRLWENELSEEQVQDAIPAESIDHDAPQPNNTRAASRGVLNRSARRLRWRLSWIRPSQSVRARKPPSSRNTFARKPPDRCGHRERSWPPSWLNCAT